MTLRASLQDSQAPQSEIVKDHVLVFAGKLQRRYPFQFAKAFRHLEDEQNRWIQERLMTYFLFGAVAELSGIDDATVQKIWKLGVDLSRTIGKGGEHFRPKEFDSADKTLAEEIGEKNFDLLVLKLEELGHQMEFKMGPVNPAEHVIIWCFRYMRQLLLAAKWESVPRRR
jgi:hypothetical protein